MTMLFFLSPLSALHSLAQGSAAALEIPVRNLEAIHADFQQYALEKARRVKREQVCNG